MFAVVNALGPVFLVILLGVLLKRIDFPGGQFWLQAERFIYFFLFPMLLTHSLAQADFSQVSIGLMASAVLLVIVLNTTVLLGLQRWLKFTASDLTSVYQGSVRFNSYVAIGTTGALYGSDGIAIAAVVMAVMIPLLNIACVAMFAWFIPAKDQHPLRAATMAIAQNPLIIGCAIGATLNITGLGLPGWSAATFDIVSRAALPMGLLAVGVALNVHALKRTTSAFWTAHTLKLLVMPVLAFAVAKGFGLSLLAAQVLMLFCALPTATSSYILAKQMGGNAELMASVVTAQTLLAMLTMPLLLAQLASWY